MGWHKGCRMTVGQEMVGNQVWAWVQPDPATVEDRVRVAAQT